MSISINYKTQEVGTILMIEYAWVLVYIQYDSTLLVQITDNFWFELILLLPFTSPLFDEADFKNLRSLEICGGGLTDTGVKNIKNLSSLMLLNLSQNSNLTDKTLELISGISMNLFWCVCGRKHAHTHICLHYLLKLSY